VQQSVTDFLETFVNEVFICDAIRTPFGRYGGALASIRTDDLAAIPLRGLVERNPRVDWMALDDVVFGCANQAGEDNRNVARMALLLAGLPKEIPGSTVNRLCGSSMDAIGVAARVAPNVHNLASFLRSRLPTGGIGTLIVGHLR